MKSITIHNLDKETIKRLEKIAKEKNLNLNKVIKQLLQNALGINSNKGTHRNEEFKEFLGIWNEKYLNEFEKKTVSLNTVNTLNWQ